MRHEARAYGSRDEIERDIRNGISGHRSERRLQEGSTALDELADGADRVTFGKILYIVDDD